MSVREMFFFSFDEKDRSQIDRIDRAAVVSESGMTTRIATNSCIVNSKRISGWSCPYHFLITSKVVLRLLLKHALGLKCLLPRSKTCPINEETVEVETMHGDHGELDKYSQTVKRYLLMKADDILASYDRGFPFSTLHKNLKAAIQHSDEKMYAYRMLILIPEESCEGKYNVLDIEPVLKWTRLPDSQRIVDGKGQVTVRMKQITMLCEEGRCSQRGGGSFATTNTLSKIDSTILDHPPSFAPPVNWLADAVNRLYINESNKNVTAVNDNHPPSSAPPTVNWLADAVNRLYINESNKNVTAENDHYCLPNAALLTNVSDATPPQAANGKDKKKSKTAWNEDNDIIEADSFFIRPVACIIKCDEDDAK